jgi:hypothetical protein
MKIKSLILGGVLVASVLVFAGGARPGPAIITDAGDTNFFPLASYKFRDHWYLCIIHKSNFLSGPFWLDRDPEPPLSPGSALVLARRHAHLLVPDIERFDPKELVLKKLIVWFYVITLEPFNPRDPSHAPTAPIQIVVLMDGTIAKRIEQEPVRVPSG